KWKLFKTGLVPGEEYSFTLTADDPGFGEILATNAIHLDVNYSFISNIFDEAREKDNVWCEVINSGEYVRVAYEKNLTNGNVIDVFVRSPRDDSGEPGNGSFEVYIRGDDSNLLGSSGFVDSDGEWKYITLENMIGFADIFDFKISGSLEFDYIHDEITDNIFPNSLSNEDGDAMDVTQVDEAAPGDGVTEFTGKSSDPVNPSWIQCGYPSANLPTTAIVQNMTFYWGHNDESNWALTTQDPYTGLVWSPDGSSTFFNVTDYTVSTSDIDENYTLTTNLPTGTQLNNGIYLRFIGYDSNAGAEDDLFLDYCYYTVGYFNDTISPTVSLNSPLNNSVANSPINFNYTPSDNFALDSCELWGNWSLSFPERVISTTADAAFSVFAIDVDGDGDIDVLSASANDDTIAWYENNGSESFTQRIISTTADSARSVFAIDVDNDGDIDVLSASANDDTIAWYENNGSESFTEHNISTTANSARSVFAIDVDNDGDIDVLSASLDDDKITWYENNGSESFTQRIISTTADGAFSVFAIDVDGDNDTDVLSASFIDDKIAWYENTYVWGNVETDNNPTNGTSNIFSSVNIADGDWKWNVQCIDLAGNSAFAPANYSLTVGIDESPPIITITNPINNSAINDDPVFLNATTDKNADCEYSTTLTFNYGAGTNFTTSGETTHGTSLGSLAENTYNYYVKCNDSLENNNTDANQGYVTFTVDRTLPASITNLANQSSSSTSIYWNWTNPVSDFNSTIIYINGSNVANTSNNFYNATGLLPNTNYTITIHTKDNAGNVNNTDVNSTASTLVNNPPQITQVQPLSTITLTSFSITNVNVLFNVTDTDGFADLNDSLARCDLSKTGEATRNSTSCTAQNQSGNDLVYSCTVNMQFYDSAGNWNVTCYAEDNSGLNNTNNTETATVNALNYVTQDLSSLNWSSLIPGNNDKEAQAPLILSNGGNQNYSDFNISSQNATFSSNTITNDKFKVDNETNQSSGQTFLNDSGVIWTEGSLPKCNSPCSSNSTEVAYFYVDTPTGILGGIYASIANWTISIS
ncbi:MAG: VCBS repeat-containing protein, partial [Thaumarchaeota archaeon]|nr:VCBS repeat-containing protein [Nitrososphaerota archaeon]